MGIEKMMKGAANRSSVDAGSTQNQPKRKISHLTSVKQEE